MNEYTRFNDDDVFARRCPDCDGFGWKPYLTEDGGHYQCLTCNGDGRIYGQ